MERRSSRRALIEPMESRTLLSATVTGSPVISNVSKLVGPQQTETVTINPANPSVVYLVANNDGQSLVTGTSIDGGHTWFTQVKFNGSDGFPPAQNSATAMFDKFGNLFVAYRRSDTGSTIVLYSYDDGETFHTLANLSGLQSLPILATGNGTLWLGLQQSKETGNPVSVQNSGAVAYVSKVTGLGRIGPLTKVSDVTGVNSMIEGLAVGPAGQVAAAYQFNTQVGPTIVYTRTDPDGLGPKKFTTANEQVTTQVGVADVIPAQATAGVSASASLAFDASSDGFTGRLYMAYTDAPNPASANTNIFLVFSDNDGLTWSAPQKVNDDPSTNSHFMPQVAVDPVTGSVAVTWYDARNDNAIPGSGGTNNTANDDVQVYGAVGTPTTSGVSFSPNFVVQPAYSNSADILTVLGAPNPDQFGLHNGIAFNNGVLITTWADNSNSTGNNFNGPLSQPDVYSAIMTVTTTPAPTGTLVGAFGVGNPPLTYTTASGVKATLQLNQGHGYVFSDPSGNLKLRVSGTTATSVLTVTARGGAGTLDLADVTINGAIGTINAPTVNVTGNFSVNGAVKRATFASVNGGTFSSLGSIGTFTARSLTSATVLAGAAPGGDLVFSGPTDTDDTFQAASISSLVVRGAITGSIIAAGVNPVDGVFANGNDVAIGGTASRIGSIRAGSADTTTTRFEAGSFGTVRVPNVLDPTTDQRFMIV